MEGEYLEKPKGRPADPPDAEAVKRKPGRIDVTEGF